MLVRVTEDRFGSVIMYPACTAGERKCRAALKTANLRGVLSAYGQGDAGDDLLSLIPAGKARDVRDGHNVVVRMNDSVFFQLLGVEV